MIDEPNKSLLQEWFTRLTEFPKNSFHPLVWIIGEPEIGEHVQIGGLSEVNAKGASVKIGDHCDIASFVTINCADSHMKCIGLSADVARRDILIETHVFIGSHSVIKGGARIGHHSVIAAGTVVGAIEVAPYSLVAGNPAVVKPGYYLGRVESGGSAPQ